MTTKKDARILLKRTSTPGKTPTGTTGDESGFIKQGELAINTADKKIFSFDGTNIFEPGENSFLGLTGGTINGNLSIQGSETETQNLTVSGNTYVSGGLTASTISATTLSASTIYSGSTNLYDIFESSPTLPGGSNTQIQYNNNGVFSGDTGFTYVNGMVGIGVTNPTYALHVSGSGAAGQIYVSSAAVIGNSQLSTTGLLGYYGGIFTINNYINHSAAQLSIGTKNVEAIRIDNSQNVGIGTTSPTEKLVVSGNTTITGDLVASTKSFVIPHPTKEGKKLHYGSLEGPEHGVYYRGRLKKNNVIELPDYWEKLVDENSISVELTPIGNYQKLFIKSISNNKIYVGNKNWFNKNIDCYFTVFAMREKINVEE